MFDQLTQKPAHWADHVRPGDVVLFKFPVAFPQTRDGKPGIRPCLVVEVDDVGEERRLVLAYSTTATTRSNGGYDIAADRRRERSAAPVTVERRRRLKAKAECARAA